MTVTFFQTLETKVVILWIVVCCDTAVTIAVAPCSLVVQTGQSRRLILRYVLLCNGTQYCLFAGQCSHGTTITISERCDYLVKASYGCTVTTSDTCSVRNIIFKPHETMWCVDSYVLDTGWSRGHYVCIQFASFTNYKADMSWCSVYEHWGHRGLKLNTVFTFLWSSIRMPFVKAFVHSLKYKLAKQVDWWCSTVNQTFWIFISMYKIKKWIITWNSYWNK